MTGAEEELCDYCFEPVREHTISEWMSCQADIRAAEEAMDKGWDPSW